MLKDQEQTPISAKSEKPVSGIKRKSKAYAKTFLCGSNKKRDALLEEKFNDYKDFALDYKGENCSTQSI